MSYVDSGPDATITADSAAIVADDAAIVQFGNLVPATPNSIIVHAEDQELVSMDDLVKAEQQKAIDYVTNVLGETGPNEATAEATQNLGAITTQETIDRNLP